MKFASPLSRLALVLAAGLSCSWTLAETRAVPLPVSLPEPLAEAARQAIVGSPDIQERWKAWRASQQATAAARAGWRPQASVQTYAGRQDRHDPGLDRGDFSVRGVELELTQLLFDAGRTRARVDQAGAAEAAAWQALLGSAEVVALQVSSAYLDLLRQQERVALASANYAEHQRTFDTLQERTRAGVGRRADAEQARGRLAVAESVLVDETTALRQAALAYQRQVGVVPPLSLPVWPEGRVLADLPKSALATLQQGTAHSPVLRAAFLRWQAAEHAGQERRAAFWPEAQARVSVAQSHNRDGVRGEFRDEQAELVLSQNLYRGGADRAALRRADERVSVAQAEFDATCRQVQQELSVAYNDVQTLQTQELLRDQRRLAAEKAAQAIRQQFDLGQRTLLDVLDTQFEYFSTALAYSDARHNRLRAQARTLAAQGRLVALLGSPLTVPEGSTTDAGEQGSDAASLCPAQPTFMDSLERIKASLAPPPRPSNYVVLLPNADGTVGQVEVSGSAGQQRLSQPLTATSTDGGQVPYSITPEQLRQDFGPALDAQPPQPQRLTLYFRSGSTQLTAESEVAWAAWLAEWRQRPQSYIQLAGHADTVSYPQVNEALAWSRARSLEQRLRNSGFAESEIEVQAFGSRQPEVPTPDQTDEPRNRRVVITVR